MRAKNARSGRSIYVAGTGADAESIRVCKERQTVYFSSRSLLFPPFCVTALTILKKLTFGFGLLQCATCTGTIHCHQNIYVPVLVPVGTTQPFQ